MDAAVCPGHVGAPLAFPERHEVAPSPWVVAASTLWIFWITTFCFGNPRRRRIANTSTGRDGQGSLGNQLAGAGATSTGRYGHRSLGNSRRPSVVGNRVAREPACWCHVDRARLRLIASECHFGDDSGFCDALAPAAFRDKKRIRCQRGSLATETPVGGGRTAGTTAASTHQDPGELWRAEQDPKTPPHLTPPRPAGAGRGSGAPLRQRTLPHSRDRRRGAAA
eukprot:gene20085-biopygen23533